MEVTGIEPVSETTTTISFYKLSLLLKFAVITPVNRANYSYSLEFPSNLEKSFEVIHINRHLLKTHVEKVIKGVAELSS